jgi:hypothetical protein
LPLGRKRPWIPSGKPTKNYGKSQCLQFLMGKSTISMAMFNSFLYVYQRVSMGGEEQVLLTNVLGMGL